MTKKVNIAVVGTGLMGLQHIKAVNKSKKASLHSFVDINKKFEIDHYYPTKNGYSSPMKQFWDVRYDLILFDNQGVQ